MRSVFVISMVEDGSGHDVLLEDGSGHDVLLGWPFRGTVDTRYVHIA